MITIQAEGISTEEVEILLIVPEAAIEEAGYITTLTVGDNAQAKHTYHALSQMAYFQFQDDELEIIEVEGPITIDNGEEKRSITSGIILFRSCNAALKVYACGNANSKKLLETCYRYCTRWVRLDI